MHTPCCQLTWQHQEKSWKCWDSNPGRRGAELERYRCAMATPHLTGKFIMSLSFTGVQKLELYRTCKIGLCCKPVRKSFKAWGPSVEVKNRQLESRLTSKRLSNNGLRDRSLKTLFLDHSKNFQSIFKTWYCLIERMFERHLSSRNDDKPEEHFSKIPDSEDSNKWSLANFSFEVLLLPWVRSTVLSYLFGLLKFGSKQCTVAVY